MSSPVLAGEETFMYELPSDGNTQSGKAYIEQTTAQEGKSNTYVGDKTSASGGGGSIVPSKNQEIILATDNFTADFRLSEHFTLGMMFDGGFSEMVCQTEEEEERKEFVKIISSNNILLLQLIDDILDLSKIEAGTMEFTFAQTDINELMEGICRQMQEKNSSPDIQILFTEKADQCMMYTDRIRLSQVIINFTNNALKFTPKGSIEMGYRIEEAKDEIYFYVKDTGIGIPADKIDKVFERFVKLNSFIKGTGLGLAICRVIVERLGGVIGVESKEGEGSRFWFRIPRSEKIEK
jgi:signal transduction histidine kinase